MKENQHVKPVVDVVAGTVTFEVKGKEALVLHMDKLHPDIVKRAALVGMAQVRIVDAAAVGAADAEGNIIPEADRIGMKHSNMAELIAHYETGTAEWSRAGSGGGSGAKSLTLEAIARVSFKGDYDAAGRSVEAFAVEKTWDRKKALAFLATGKRVMEAMAAIRAERQPEAKVDADAALGELSKS